MYNDNLPIAVLTDDAKDNFLKYELQLLNYPLKQPNKTAFTLAEILITLGIIGVVAALSIPPLVVNIKEKTLESQLSKAKNTIANGYKLMMSKNSITKLENLPFLENCGGDIYCIAKEHRASFDIVQDTADGLTGDDLPTAYAITDNETPSEFHWSDVPYMFRTGDGIAYGIIPDEDLKNFSVVIDINGAKKPNTVSKDLYKLKLSDDGAIADISSELAEVSNCSVENPEGCKTQSACMNAVGGATDETWFEGGKFDSDGNCIRTQASWWGGDEYNKGTCNIWTEEYPKDSYEAGYYCR